MQENFNPQNEKLAQKQAEWEKMSLFIDKAKDGLGRGIEDGIKEAVIVFNLLGFPTAQSCEGHTKEEDWGQGYPWVHFSQQRNEKYRAENEFIGQVGKILKKYRKEELVPMYGDGRLPKEAWKKYHDFEKSLPEYPEYVECLTKIAEGNKELHLKLDSLIEEFYSKENTDTDVKYHIDSFDKKHIVELTPENDSEFEDVKEHNDFLEKSRTEMNRLTEFLKNKYFSE